jgi:hypothetical protein
VKSETEESKKADSSQLAAVNYAKETVAKRHGYFDNVIGTRWEYAMMLTHRRKAQLDLYEEVLIELLNIR